MSKPLIKRHGTGTATATATARAYVERVEQLLGAPVRYIGVGAHRDALIDRGEDH